MRVRIAVTGRPGIGKSTVIRKVVERLRAEGVRVGGMLSSNIRKGGRRVGFEILDVMSGRRGVLAHIGLDGPRVGKYGVNMQDLEDIGVFSITNAAQLADVVVIDEIAPMELKSEKFITAVEEVLSSEKHMLVSVHHNLRHGLAMRVKKEFELLEVTIMNREELPELISERYLRALMV
ncbi:MAG TPA: NTPase [Methanomicrobia archaeon]|nr:NTPase [Methanomicrobia archaeon]HEX59733.1 NTPase [Methanomicrobia archaeon]